MDYAALKAEIALPAYAGMTDAQIAAALVAPLALTGQPFAWGAAKRVAQVSGAWGKIIKRAQLVPSGAPGDEAIYAAANAVSMDDAQAMDPAETSGWAAFQSGIGALQTAGDLSAADVAALAALGNQATTRAAQIGWVILTQMDEASAVYHIETARTAG